MDIVVVIIEQSIFFDIIFLFSNDTFLIWNIKFIVHFKKCSNDTLTINFIVVVFVSSLLNKLSFRLLSVMVKIIPFTIYHNWSVDT